MLNKIRGGVHPHDQKERTAGRATETLPLPARLIIPVRQHIGDPAVPTVAKGDLVLKGQIIADLDNGRTPPIHASTSGKVADVGNYPHPLFGQALSIVIEPDGNDQWAEGLPLERKWEDLTAEEMIKIIFRSGIVGMNQRDDRCGAVEDEDRDTVGAPDDQRQTGSPGDERIDAANGAGLIDNRNPIAMRLLGSRETRVAQGLSEFCWEASGAGLVRGLAESQGMRKTNQRRKGFKSHPPHQFILWQSPAPAAVRTARPRIYRY